VGRHRSDPRGLGRYLLLGVVAVVVLVLVIVGVLALRGALSSKKPAHSPTPSSVGNAQSHTVEQSSPVPALLIKIIREPCRVFVKNASNNNVLQSDNASPPRGARLRFVQIPLQVQISDANCVDVYVHGRRKRDGGAGGPWIFTVDS
jgi:hypothetical protein